MKKPSRLDYAYAVGRVRVLERGLVEEAVFREAVMEKDFACAMKVIFDAGSFREEMVEIQDSDELDEFLEKEEKNLYRLMMEILLEEDILSIIIAENQLEDALAIAEGIDYSFFKNYFRYKIDLGNLKIFCRLKYSGLSREKLRELILNNGFLDKEILLQNFDLTWAEMGEKLRASPYQELWNKATDILEERETFVELERGIENFLMTYLQGAKYIVFGPEPVFAYALAKRRELSLVRLLGVGKLSHLPHEFLRERISKTYV